MKITKNMKNYEPLVIPLNKPIAELTKKEAKEYFDWFLSHIDERADYLREKVSAGLDIPMEQLDFSLESLRPIWRWFLSVAEVSKIHRGILERVKRGMKGQAQTFADHFCSDDEEELSVFTMYVVRDIAMYAGKVFTLNYPAIKWTYVTKPKSYVYVNEPLLVGFVDDNPKYPKIFYPDINPFAEIHVQALNILDHTQSEDDLYKVGMRWLQWIPEEGTDK